MKKKVLLLVGSLLVLSSCSGLPNQAAQDEVQAAEFGVFINKLVVLLKEKRLEEKEKELATASSSEEAAAKAKAADAAAQEQQATTDTGGAQNNGGGAADAQADLSQYPYMVSLSDLSSVGRFTISGMNIPNNIDLAFLSEANGAVTMSFNQPGANIFMYTASYHQIPTRTIRVYTAGSNAIRTVSVNSEIVLEYLASAYGGLDQGNLYVFTNSGGGLSLATPNYAGNVPPGEGDVMLEYLP